MIRRSLIILPAAAVALVPALLAFLTTAAPRAHVQTVHTGAVTAPPPVVELLSRGSVAKPFDAEARGIELEASRKIDSAVAHLTFEPGASTGWHTLRTHCCHRDRRGVHANRAGLQYPAVQDR